MTEWKKIPGRKNYSVSIYGDIRNDSTGRILKQSPNKCGYSRVSISNGTGKNPDILFPHRAVAIAFLENKENKPFVNHIDGNKQNPSLSNLEWVTGKENARHAIEVGLFDSKATSAKATLASLEKTCKPVAVLSMAHGLLEFKSKSEASRVLGFSAKYISKINLLE